MGKLFDVSTTKRSLRHAWLKIRANGLRSELHETREAVAYFDQDPDLFIHQIQKRLRDGTFVFEPQKGVLKRKASGGYRGIVMAPVRNRIVERALLDALQEHVQYVGQVISTPTSIGGVPDRSVPHGLVLLRQYMAELPFFVKADISGFFDHIPRNDVIAKLNCHVADESFLRLLGDATTVTLKNEVDLGEDRSVFPTDVEGVAQGSPLSPLFGNILLSEFDKKFNERGIVCIRFIDDFVMLGSTEGVLRKAFQNARAHLEALGLRCHDPFVLGTSKDKAQFGKVADGFVFLGYDIRPGLFQPSAKAKSSLLASIDRCLEHGRHSILEVMKAENSFAQRQRYIQSLDLTDRIVRGWGEAFAYSNAPYAFGDLDEKIDERLDAFRSWMRRQTESVDWRAKRRMSGVGLLTDVRPKNLADLPERLTPGKSHRKTSRTIVISTDGSVIRGSARLEKEKGPGGWGAVFHLDGRQLYGGVALATNNEMELTAVVEALKQTPNGSRVQIRTDSQYVCNAAKGKSLVRSNKRLWNEYRQLCDTRLVSTVWVKGHAGDSFNEAADRIANEQALRAKREKSM